MFFHIEPGLRHLENRDMVFGAIYCDAAEPYIKYDQVDPKDRGRKIPLVLMLLRWDGCIGFPGGKVDAGETLMQAFCRELSEEINFIPHEINATLLCSFTDETDNMHIHCFEYQVSEYLLREIIQDASEAEHFLAETQGVFAAQIAEFKGRGGFSEFRKNNFKATAGMELDFLVKKHEWLS